MQTNATLFFQLVKLAREKVVWTKECEEVFTSLKEQLTRLPTLSLMGTREPLTLYVAWSEFVVSVVLLFEREAKSAAQNPIYYLSRALQGAKQMYPPIEKLALAMVVVAWRLHPYFQVHVIIIPKKYLLL